MTRRRRSKRRSAAFGDLIRQGKVRHVGASNYTADRLAEALRVAKANRLPIYECLQPLYNLCEREPFEAALQSLCIKEGLAVIPYFSLAAGFLTGKYRTEADLAKSPRSARQEIPQRSRLPHPRGARQGGHSIKATPGQVALARLVTLPGVTAPIVSATNLDQFNDLVTASRLELDNAAADELDRASAWN